ncbi:MAG: hypothetical protein MJ185_02685 [Treponema sp.]|nr:hypothetical protein [Treponema sp.]
MEEIIPEFALITQHGLKTFKNMKLLKKNDEENSFVVGNGEITVSLSEETYREVTAPERFEKIFDEFTPAYEKLTETQYEDFFRQRENTAYNFRHNFGVYCRKEASSPVDALKIAKELVSRMSKDEKQKTQGLLQNLAHNGESLNQFLVRTYLDSVKEVPLNEEHIRNTKVEKFIARPFFDTLSDKGQLVDNNSKLCIGDTIKDLVFNVEKVFGSGKESLSENLTVISSSKEANKIVLMDKDKSYYEVPRDVFLEGYNRQQEKLHKLESRQHKSTGIEMSW